MSTKYGVLALLAAFFAFIPSRLSPYSDEPRLVIAFTGEANGYIEPCG